jgi:dihydroxyacetone kinase phosphoprotein-dependent L subunit
MEKLGVNFFKCFLYKSSEKIISNEQFLTDLDSQIGDSDFGINLSRAFKIVKNNIKGENIGELFKEAGEIIMEQASGTFGTLLGSMFIRMSDFTLNKNEITLEEFIIMFEEGVNWIENIGGAKMGDKTMLDALIPFVKSLKNYKEKNIKNIFEDAIKAAYNGMNSTKDMIAKVGRGSYYGERSKGHLDPGAVAIYLILKNFIECIQD